MRKSRFTEHQILNILAEAATGKAITEVCTKHGISVPTFYLWKAKFQKHSGASRQDLDAIGQDAAPSSAAASRASKSTSEELISLRNRVAELEKENDQLRRIYIDLSLDRVSFRLNNQDRKTQCVA